LGYANFKDIFQFIKFDLKLIFRKRKRRYFDTKLTQKKTGVSSFNHKSFKAWSQRTELNYRPADYESVALLINPWFN